MSKIPFPGMTFERRVVKKRNDIFIYTTTDGKTKEIKYTAKKDFDFMTGDPISKFISPKKPLNKIRFLDLENGTLVEETYTLNNYFYQKINNRKELIYDVRIKSKHKNEKIQVIVSKNIPVKFELNVPFVGKIKVRLKRCGKLQLKKGGNYDYTI
jgi:hypothetical protein